MPNLIDTLEKTSVTLKMLIDSHLLSIGQQIFCVNQNAIGFLNDDGSITISINGEKMIFGYLSGAARYVEGRSLNGWLYWQTLVDGEKHPLGIFREKYIKQFKDSERH